jgi:hypothetical protein
MGVGGSLADLEHFHKYCSHSAGTNSAGVLLGSGFVLFRPSQPKPNVGVAIGLGRTSTWQAAIARPRFGCRHLQTAIDREAKPTKVRLKPLHQSAIHTHAMRHALIFIAMILPVTGCGPGDAKTRSQIIGTWSQGLHTLTLATDGTFTSIFPADQRDSVTTFYGNWNVKWERLMFTNIRSNSVSIPNVGSSRIVSVDEHHLDLDEGTGTFSLAR